MGICFLEGVGVLQIEVTPNGKLGQAVDVLSLPFTYSSCKHLTWGSLFQVRECGTGLWVPSGDSVVPSTAESPDYRCGGRFCPVGEPGVTVQLRAGLLKPCATAVRACGLLVLKGKGAWLTWREHSTSATPGTLKKKIIIRNTTQIL